MITLLNDVTASQQQQQYTHHDTLNDVTASQQQQYTHHVGHIEEAGSVLRVGDLLQVFGVMSLEQRVKRTRLGAGRFQSATVKLGT